MDGDGKLSALLMVAAWTVLLAALIAGLVTLAPRTTPEAERAQRVTAPWLTGDR